MRQVGNPPPTWRLETGVRRPVGAVFVLGGVPSGVLRRAWEGEWDTTTQKRSEVTQKTIKTTQKSAADRILD